MCGCRAWLSSRSGAPEFERFDPYARLWNAVSMVTAPPKKRTKKESMSAAHKAALAKGREEGRIVRRYLEGLEAAKPRRGRKRTPDSIRRRLATIDATINDSDPLARLHLIEEKQRLEDELNTTGTTVDLPALE